MFKRKNEGLNLLRKRKYRYYSLSQEVEDAINFCKRISEKNGHNLMKYSTDDLKREFLESLVIKEYVKKSKFNLEEIGKVIASLLSAIEGEQYEFNTYLEYDPATDDEANFNCSFPAVEMYDHIIHKSGEDLSFDVLYMDHEEFSKAHPSTVLLETSSAEDASCSSITFYEHTDDDIEFPLPIKDVGWYIQDFIDEVIKHKIEKNMDELNGDEFEIILNQFLKNNKERIEKEKIAREDEKKYIIKKDEKYMFLKMCENGCVSKSVTDSSKELVSICDYCYKRRNCIFKNSN